MCFSATASFTTAAVVSVAGFVALSRTDQARQLPFAATPILFGIQQGTEGLLWLTLPTAPDTSISNGLTILFLFFAQVFWPVYSPVAAFLIETDERRRLIMIGCGLVGVSVSTYLLWSILVYAHGAALLDGHIVYLTGHRHSDVLGLLYLIATGVPLLISSQRTAVVLGAVVIVGATTAYVLYWEAFVSVWCFFAAGSSAIILFHFEQARRQRLRAAG